ncbi:hypothetical protein CHU92_00150 [Flavobacterium cyanobacteriorum]|uniref:Uncharacterized protein n=1 Tax=Flavobacterium cyanobacteriorum TaxID=2022802 RepID=A0A256AA03_9FLAO|nr:hypothetical protein [Flavobacterium cyanobacteriorum]OYQ50045.1 hypothetical protein CHU92_00150 [Flavobacterium cyanobacteriorum]
MEFKLIYEGKLKSNADATEKHRIRQVFHEQLKNAWKYPPLNEVTDWVKIPPIATSSFTSVKNVGGHNFATLVCKTMSMYCELDLLILKPDISHGAFGDLDNKLKTIFDALRYPNKVQEIPSSWTPNADQTPLICLLEDDDLITRFNVNVDRLLRNASTDDIVMIITVKVKGVGARVGSLSLIV